jgi:hypothetical protein
MPDLPAPVWGAILTASVTIAVLLIHVWRDRIVLRISQTGSNVTNRIAATDDGLAWYYMAEVRIINDSRSRSVTLNGFDLRLDWNDPDFGPLPDPVEAVGEERPYSVPGTTLRFPYQAVINHRTGSRGVMRPGDTIEGLFLARGFTAPPYPHGTEVDLPFFVLDQRWKRHKELFRFFIWSYRAGALPDFVTTAPQDT